MTVIYNPAGLLKSVIHRNSAIRSFTHIAKTEFETDNFVSSTHWLSSTHTFQLCSVHQFGCLWRARNANIYIALILNLLALGIHAAIIVEPWDVKVEKHKDGTWKRLRKRGTTHRGKEERDSTDSVTWMYIAISSSQLSHTHNHVALLE